MLKRITLRTRILVLLSALVAITVAGGVMAIGYTYMMDGFFATLVDTDLEALVASKELENTLIMQKGYVTYYFTDKDPTWLDQLDYYHRSFEDWLKKARQFLVTEKERALLNELESKYIRFAQSRDDVIAKYATGDSHGGFELHKKIRVQFFSIMGLCNQFQNITQERITEARRVMRTRIQIINVLTVLGLVAALMTSIILAYILLNDVLEPIRQLATKTDDGEPTPFMKDEIKALRVRFQLMKDNVDQAKTKLKWSHEHLELAEKWAMVGKLAAGVAHSVRNPLTSVKMRLFSLDRTLALDAGQREDFEVITEEIAHIDTILGNFLEFSRPPKLKMQRVSPSDVVDMAVQLLRHRLESQDVVVHIRRESGLPEVQADPDQLKEVFVNLFVNACEAMVDSGVITITELEKDVPGVGRVAVIKLHDTGPGIPEHLREDLFRPFFSTKEEGTGLGLSIAARIVAEHGGALEIESQNGQGTTFIISLPEEEGEKWPQSS